MLTTRALPASLFLLLCAAPSLVSQAPKPLSGVAESITEQDVIRHIKVIADDSMMGRDTPSRGLDLTAQYVADQFRAAGLQPAGDSGTWFQRYPITRRHIDAKASSLTFRSGKTETRVSLAVGARFIQGTVPAAPVGGEVLLLGGAVTADVATGAGAAGRMVLLISDPARPAFEQTVRALYLVKPKAIILLADADSAAYLSRLASQQRDRTVIDLGIDRPLIVEARESAVARVLAAAGARPAALRTDPTPVVRNLSGLKATVELKEVVQELFLAIAGKPGAAGS